MWANQESTGPSVALGGEGRWVPPRWCRARGCAACESPGWVLAALIAALSWTPAGQLAAQTLATLHAFSALGSTNADGANPQAGLILSGNTLYGTAQNGGTSGYGAVFSVNTDGTGLTSLHSFTGGSDGANPQAGLILSGNTLFGTAYGGGSGGAVFSVSTDGTGFKTLHAFSALGSTSADGRNPYAGLILSGNTLYGTAQNGGTSGHGAVFSVNTDGTGFTNLHSFTGGSDGANPQAGLVLSGNTLYGTAAYGGSSGGGTVFRVNTDGTGFTNLHSFSEDSDGALPQAGLILSGNTLYGTASAGGSSGQGTVFRVNTDGTGFTTLHSFTGGNDGGDPRAGLVLSGNTLYGTASAGGSSGQGTVFSVNTDGTGFAALHGFSPEASRNADGANALAGLISSSNTLYGTASAGGSSGQGTVFRVNTDGTGFTTLHSFTGGNDGGDPRAGLVLSGNTLYGTASASGSSGHGTVFSVKTDGSAFTTLHSFAEGNDGAWPLAGLILSGNALYGTATLGGGSSSRAGMVFSVNTDGTGFTTLHSFSGGSDGANPQAGLVLSGNTLYGTAAYGGLYRVSGGTVFSVNTDGTGFKTLHTFTGTNDGAEPYAGLVLSGNTLYGTAAYGGSSNKGTVFSVSTDGTGFTTLYSFTGGSDQASPHAGLLLSGNTLYGATDNAFFTAFFYGESSGTGTVFRVNTDGTGFKTLYRFTGGSDGGDPFAGLILSGNTLYGTAQSGGSSGNGTVFSLSLPPQLTIIPSRTNLILTWPAYATGFTLQFTTNLASPATWTTVSPGPVVVSGLNTVTNPITGAQQFYRLSQ